MILIIEGLDCTGKTTWAKEFCDKYNFIYKVGLKTDDEKKKISQIYDLEDEINSCKDILYDRCTLIDNFVYKKLNKTWKCMAPYKDKISEVLSKCIIVHFYIDEDERKRRMDERGDKWLTNDDMKEIKDNYDKTYRMLNIDVNYVRLDDKAFSYIIDLIN